MNDQLACKKVSSVNNMTKRKVLLMENISEAAVELFRDFGCEVVTYKKAIPEAELCEVIADVDLIGVRSKTILTKNVSWLEFCLTVSTADCVINVFIACAGGLFVLYLYSFKI